MEKQIDYNKRIKQLMDTLVNRIYDSSANFPKSELFGLTSQIRRSSLSVVLNYIEGYARLRKAVFKTFLEISFGSLKETEYLIFFSNKRNYLSDKDYKELTDLINEIARMLWGIISKL